MSRIKIAPLAVIVTVFAATSLLATIDNQKQFVGAFPDAKAKLGKCTTCHTKALPKKDDHAVNAYGKDLVEKAVVDAKAEKKSYDFTKIASLDSDGDGVTNANEIKAATNPGDPTSK